ncbi:MAG: cytochrome-c oxidase, cbb3-type subunit III [Halioglobus sp.]|nr:cytochrome-c oxidase, cbb3-type subunit III [Halioglobus sp.]
MASHWSLWVIVLTTITFIGLVWILFGNRKREGKLNEKTTGHVYDGIEEYDNPLPAWWFYMFVLTIVWGVAYLIIYPGMGNFPGLLGWTQLEQHEREVNAAQEKYRAMRDRYLALPVAEIASDPAVRKMGMRMFGNNCAQCHGGDARGSYGFPDLTDDDWVYGGTPEAIKTSIASGRQAVMPPWGDVIGEDGVQSTTAYVLSLNGREVDAATAAAGKPVYAQFCAACHGAEAEGNPMLGAPNLKNGIWLYGGTAEQIGHSIRAGRNGMMPAHDSMLGEDKIHLLTAYVYGLGQ